MEAIGEVSMGRSFVNTFKNLFLLATALLLVVALTACGKKDVQAAGPGGAGASRPAAPVVVATVEQRNVPVQIRAIGNVEAYQSVQVKSMVNGQIEKIFFKEGQDVRQGQLLFQLDRRPFEADLEKALGTLRHDEATATQSELQAKRYTELEQQGVISKEQADQFRAQAKADASAVYADKAAVDAARVQLAYTDIAAPINARTGAVMIHKGNLVKANDTPYLVQLNQVAPIYVTFSIPETDLAEVRQFAASHQLKVMATPKGQNTTPAVGELTFIDNGVDTTTGTVKLKATFTNKDRRLWPGEFADVVLDLSTRKNAILVPTKAVQSGQQGDYVYVVTPQNTAESRNVQPAGTFQNMTIVSAGVQPGEKVITEGLLRVAPNSKVVVQNAQETPAKTNPAGSGQ
jgi:membrane fusion protein, multidrug efflux system